MDHYGWTGSVISQNTPFYALIFLRFFSSLTSTLDFCSFLNKPNQKKNQQTQRHLKSKIKDQIDKPTLTSAPNLQPKEKKKRGGEGTKMCGFGVKRVIGSGCKMCGSKSLFNGVVGCGLLRYWKKDLKLLMEKKSSRSSTILPWPFQFHYNSL